MQEGSTQGLRFCAWLLGWGNGGSRMNCWLRSPCQEGERNSLGDFVRDVITFGFQAVLLWGPSDQAPKNGDTPHFQTVYRVTKSHIVMTKGLTHT